jgi:fructokinase
MNPHIHENQKPRIGLDVGGSKIELCILHRDGSELLPRFRVNSPNNAERLDIAYNELLNTIGDLVAHAKRIAPVSCSEIVGLGIPGSPDPKTDRIKNANSSYLIGRKLRRDLEKTISGEVRLANDANCMLMSEVFDGKGLDASIAFGAILGTGVGGALAVNGHVLEGLNRNAGEWGHNRLVTPSYEKPRNCFCGRENCVETFLSGPGLSRQFAYISGFDLTAKEIFERATLGDREARSAVTEWERNLGQALANVINMLDPDVIVLAGGLSQVDGLTERLPDLVQPHLFNVGGSENQTVFRLARWGDSSGVRGAARL